MYFITTVSRDENDARCVGYYFNLEEAVEVVTNNVFDLNEEGEYSWIVIEHVAEGIYQYDSSPLWFKYNETINKYEPCQKPDHINNYWVGFAIG